MAATSEAAIGTLKQDGIPIVCELGSTRFSIYISLDTKITPTRITGTDRPIIFSSISYFLILYITSSPLSLCLSVNQSISLSFFRSPRQLSSPFLILINISHKGLSIISFNSSEYIPFAYASRKS